MRMRPMLAGLALATALGGCGSGESGGAITSEEERQLDNAAAMLDDNGVFDTSADSLTANAVEFQDAAPEGGNAATDTNAQ